jgi:cobalamin biosynthesis Mg chelatase CobN
MYAFQAERKFRMRNFGIAAITLLLAAAMAMAQTSQQTTDQSTTEKAKGAASSAVGAVKKGAETGYNKTREGVGKAFSATKNAVTGSSNNQTAEQNETSTGGTSQTATKRLPATASPLPLLGLLGLGAFSLGALRSRFLRG